MMSALGLLTACGSDARSGVGDPATSIPEAAPEGVVCEPGQIDGDLNTYTPAGYIDPELITQFEAEYGVEVVEDFYDSADTLLAKLQSGATYDLIVPSDRMVAIMIENGFLAELQKEALPNLTNLDPFFADPAYDPGGEHSVPYLWGTTGLGVDLEAVGESFPPSWGLIFDPELAAQYSGGVSLLDDERQAMGAALKYLGYSLNSTNEDQLLEAADLIATVKDRIVFGGGDFDETLVAGEVVVSQGDSDDFFTVFSPAEESLEHFSFVIPEEGAAVWVDNLTVPSSAEHPCSAHSFMNFLLEARNGAALANWAHRASPNAAAEQFILPEILENPSIYPPEEVLGRLEVIIETGDFESRYAEFFAIARS